MAATFAWGESNGAGQTMTTPTAINWKNADDNAGTAYSAAPVTAGNNSYEKWQFGIFSGTFNQISNGFYAHTATAFGTGLTLKGQPSMTADGNKLSYTTPSATTNAGLTVDMTAVTAIASGQVVWFGATSPTATKTAASTANPSYTNYLTSQLQTTTSAAPGDTATVTMTLRYDEN
jgi:hypothetical protein